MSAAMKSTECSELSLLKHQLLNRYASGEITRHELADAGEKIQPPKMRLSLAQNLLILVTIVLSAALIPPWVRREES